MANGHGGARTPSNPAPVSGPGAMSQRTDGQPIRDVTGLPYGQGADYHDLQSSAPMESAQAPANPTQMTAGRPANSTPPTPFGAPTQNPDEPVTTGAPFGPGAGPEVLAPPTDPRAYDTLRANLPVLMKLADLPSTSEATRNAIRYLRGTL